MLIYYIILAFACILAYLYDRFEYDSIARSTAFGLVLLIMTIPAAMRYGIGVDYLYTYSRLIRDVLDGFYDGSEIGYYSLEWLTIGLTGSGYMVYAVAAGLTYFLALKGLVGCGMLVGVSWFVLTLYTFTFNGIRQSVALGFILLAFKLILEKRFRLAAVILACSVTFHYSSLMCIAMMFGAMWLSKLSVRRSVAILASITFLALFIDPLKFFPADIVDGTRYMDYLVNEDYSSMSSAKLIVLDSLYACVALGFSVLILAREEVNNRRARFIAILCWLAAVVRLLGFHWFILRRFSFSTDFVIPFAVAHVLRYESRIEKTFVWIVYAFWFALFVYGLIPNAEGRCWHDVVPYRTWIDVQTPDWDVR